MREDGGTERVPEMLCWLSGRLPHHGAAGGAPSAVCADSEVTRIVEARYLEPPPNQFIYNDWIVPWMQFSVFDHLFWPGNMLLSSDAERLLIAPVPVLRLHAIPNLQFSDVVRSIARLNQRIISRS